ncbi:hypothetical protein K505DRAFT_326785 [Melanomma pulvis-pyrius CBS 109.77]|uniref:BTB domain-containing protein n=1 Tax=Melanomma pulvis-pyrius CBS 109.77 TaxID=1314802 RepID=A0A6A6X5A8_9PLEO|nr:hypothetical protein K505DRAFT_326785 [Melanomma pulvis-pyrius CBS 109.77]
MDVKTYKSDLIMESKFTIIVGTLGTHTYQRTYHLPRAFLSKHSTVFDTLPSYQTTLSLPTTCPHMFQNFLDYAYSSIYSLNKAVPSYAPIRQHTLAWLLGEALGAPTFQAAALRALHAIFEPYARSGNCNAACSPIRAADVEFACQHSKMGSVLRVLFFDAAASHWTRFEASNVGSPYNMNIDEAEGEYRWPDVCNAHADFRAIIAISLMYGEGRRGACLRDAEMYVQGKTRVFGDVVRDDKWTEVEGRNRMLPVLRQPPRPALERLVASTSWEREEMLDDEEEEEEEEGEEGRSTWWE